MQKLLTQINIFYDTQIIPCRHLEIFIFPLFSHSVEFFLKFDNFFLTFYKIPRLFLGEKLNSTIFKAKFWNQLLFKAKTEFCDFSRKKSNSMTFQVLCNPEIYYNYITKLKSFIGVENRPLLTFIPFGNVNLFLNFPMDSAAVESLRKNTALSPS